VYVFEAAMQALVWGILLDDDEDDDIGKEEIITMALEETGSAVFGGIPFGRDAFNAAQGRSGGGVYGSVLEAPSKVAKQVLQGENDKALRTAVLNLVGTATGFPSTFAGRMTEGTLQFLETGELPVDDMLMGRNPLTWK